MGHLRVPHVPPKSYSRQHHELPVISPTGLARLYYLLTKALLAAGNVILEPLDLDGHLGTRLPAKLVMHCAGGT